MKYASDGTIPITIVSGTSPVGAFNADGSANAVFASGSVPCGIRHPSGALWVTLGNGPGVYAPDGSLYVMSSGGGYALLRFTSNPLNTLFAGTGLFSLTGQAAGLTSSTAAAFTLAAGTGSFLLTGDPMTPQVAYVLPSAQGSFSLAGQAATLTKAGGASFAIAASSTTTSTSASNVTAAGSVSWTGGSNIVFVGIFYGSAASATIIAATLDSSQTLTPVSGALCNNLANGNAAQIFSITNPTGSSGTPTFTFSAALNAGWVAQVWSVATTQTAASSGAASTPTGFSANANASITIPSGGGVIGICGDQDTSAFTFTNMTTDNGSLSYPGQFGSNLAGSGHAIGGAGSSVSVTGAAAASSGPYAMALAAIAP